MGRGRKQIHTEEERKKIQREYWATTAKPKSDSEWKRLAKWRFDEGNRKIREGEREEFLRVVRKQNRERLEFIMNDAETWERLNDTTDDWLVGKARRERRMKNPGVYVKQKEVEKAESIIYGGMVGKIFEEEEKEEVEYENPYGEIPEEK